MSSTEPTRALVTVAVGCEHLLRLSAPSFRAYAQRHGYAYVELTERKIAHRLQWRKARVNGHLEKFQLGPVLERFERVLFVDVDVLLTPRAPDILARVPDAELGVVEDPAGALGWKRMEEMERMQGRFGRIPEWDRRYFNSGVMALARRHQELLSFRPERLLAGRWPEQTALNYYSVQWGLRRRFRDPRMNFLPGHPGWDDPKTRRAAWAIHYAGPQAKALMPVDAAAFGFAATAG